MAAYFVSYKYMSTHTHTQEYRLVTELKGESLERKSMRNCRRDMDKLIWRQILICVCIYSMCDSGRQRTGGCVWQQSILN